MSNKVLKTYLEFLIGQLDNVEKKINVSCGVVYRVNKATGNKEVLVIQRHKKDHWPLFEELPRGKCDKGEDENIELCLKREIKEETGLNVKIEKFIDSFSYLADKGKRLSICYCFLCRIKDDNSKVKLSHEHQSFRWISSLSLLKNILMSDMYNIVEKSGILNYSDKNIKIDKIIKEQNKKFKLRKDL